MKQRILALVLALLFTASLLVPVSAAGESANLAQAYKTVLNSASLRKYIERPVLLRDLTGDGAPEMVLMCQSRSGTELQIWTYQNGRAVKALSLNWVEVSASKHWLYRMGDGSLGWYYTNSGYDYPYSSIYHQGTRYAWNGNSFVQAEQFEHSYKENGAGSVIPSSATYNGQSVSTSRGKALDDAFLANASRILMHYMEGAPDGMTKSDASARLSSVTGQFIDVPADRYYFDAVEWAVEAGVTAGTTAYTFSPDDPCTRAQAVTFLWRAAGKPEPKKAKTPFTDVSSGAFYAKAVAWAVEAGVTNGIDKTHFGPSVTCSRAQIVTFLWRAFESPKASGSGRFSDVPKGSYYETAVRWAVDSGITNGIDKTHFGPDRPCTRAQIVTFLYRAKDTGTESEQSWDEAYEQFVLKQQFLRAGQEYSSEAGFFLVRLYDIDQDGTPELIIDNGGVGRAVRWAYIYTFQAGKVQYLDIGPSEAYSDPADSVGIYGRYSDSPNENWSKYEKKGTQIVRTSAGTFPLFTGHTEFQGLTASTDQQIRQMGWDAFLATQPLA